MRLMFAVFTIFISFAAPALANDNVINQHKSNVMRAMGPALCIDALGSQVKNTRLLPKLYIVKITTHLNVWSGIPNPGSRPKVVITNGISAGPVDTNDVIAALFTLKHPFCSDIPPPSLPQ